MVVNLMLIIYNTGMTSLVTRNTKYTKSVLDYIGTHHHVTNLQLVDALRQDFPEVSKTTIHRITVRLLEQGKIQSAPATHDNAARFDNNLVPHDHFNCRNCDRLRDIRVPRDLLKEVRTQLGKCTIDGSVVLSGICGRCSGHKGAPSSS